MSSIMLNIAKLHAVSLAASNDRYYLCGVQIETSPEGVVCVATDGRVLIAVHDAQPDAQPQKPLIVPTEFCRQKYPKGQTHAVLQEDAGGYFILDGRFRFKPIDGIFPDWRRVVPQTYSGETAQFDPRSLAAVKKAAVKLGAPETCIPYVRHNGDGPALAAWGDADVFAVVMPARAAAAAGLPAWFTDKPAPERLSKAA